MTALFFEVLNILASAGFRAYAVGRCVCDYLCGIEPSACHIVTSADYKQLKNIFKNLRAINNSISVFYRGVTFTFTCSLDAEYTDDRDIFLYLSDAKYTVLSLAVAPNGDILDYFGGRRDVALGTITPLVETSFKQNPELMVDIIAVCAEYGFRLPKQCITDIRLKAPLIKTVNRAYVLSCISRILTSDNPGFMRLLNQSGLLRYIIPQLERCFGEPQRNKYHIFDVGEHIMHAVENTENDLVLRWAALFHDVGKPSCPSTDSNGIIHFYGHHKESSAIASEFLRKYHMNEDTVSDILTLIEYHDVRIENTQMAVKRMLSKIDADLFVKLIKLQLADNSAKNPIYLDEKKAKLDQTMDIYNDIIQKGEPYRVEDLLINSRDLVNMKCHAARKIGDTLRELLDEVMQDPAKNERNYLLARAKQILSK